MMTHMRALLVTVSFTSAWAGSLEFSSTNLGKRRSLDNVKATWSTDVNVSGTPLKIETAYDMKAKPDFLKEATVSGTVAPVSFSVTQNFVSRLSKVVLSAKHSGATFKSTITGKVDVGGAWVESVKVDSVTVAKSLKPSGVGITLEPSFIPTTKLGKLKAKATYDLKGLPSGDVSLASEAVATTDGVLEKLDLTVSSKLDGRPLKSTLKPLDKSVELQLSDEQIGVATASFAMGSQPKLTVKRAFAF